jgi:hypothetical protein
MKMKTQYETLIDHLENRGSISGVEAHSFFRIRALPRRIKDLEQRGYRFERERCVDPTGQRYVRYHLLETVFVGFKNGDVQVESQRVVA